MERQDRPDGADRLRAPVDAAFDAIAPGWRPVVQAWRKSATGRSTLAQLESRLAAGATVYPARPLRALECTPREAVRVVILGQDPYHGPGQAEGLAFSVPCGVRLPPSLRNIVVELGRDLGLPAPSHGHLGAWAARGVLLLNTTLTVEDGRPASHAKIGWEVLTDELVSTVARESSPAVFMLWGAHAQAKRRLIDRGAGGRHLVLEANHPSPLSARRGAAPFIGCGHFGAASRFLEAAGRGAMEWSID